MVVRPASTLHGTQGSWLPSGWRVRVTLPQAGQVILTRGGSCGPDVVMI
jgi:hypothetical protein